MTRDELIAALQKCPQNAEVLIDDQEGVPLVVNRVGVVQDGVLYSNGNIVINLIGDEYIPETASYTS